MSAVLMTLFAVSILGALGMAVYGLRVLVGRWDQPQRFRQELQLNAVQPMPIHQPVPQPMPMPMAQGLPMPQPIPMPQPVWVPPVSAAPAPMRAPEGLATPPPLLVSPPPIAHTPPPSAAPPRPALTWIPPHRAPTPGQVSGTVAELSPRLARGSIPPDFTAEAEPDTDPGIPDLPRPEPTVQRGARYSVVRSNRR